MSTQPSRLDLSQNGDRTLVAVGVVDSHTADDLLERLRALGVDGDITLDLQGVEFIDSSGLRTVVTVHQELDDAGARLVLTQVSPSVTRLLEITGLRDHLHLG